MPKLPHQKKYCSWVWQPRLKLLAPCKQNLILHILSLPAGVPRPKLLRQAKNITLHPASMDSRAILSAQGWRGAGHSLHKTDDAIGLAKPLLLSRKDNTKGLGQKQHFTSDQWWMNAFDEQLQGLDTSKQGQVVQTITTGKLNSIEKGSLGKWALYTSFVRGGLLEGTITTNLSNETSSAESQDSDGEPNEGKVHAPPKPAKETAEEKKQRREARRKRKEQRALVKASRKALKSSKSKSADVEDDTDEEKKKRRARKEEKRRKRKESN
jgi:nucleolar protein TMA23